MKLHLLESTIDSFLSYQLLVDDSEWYFPHSLVQTFHAHWMVPGPDTLSGIYDQCLQSDISQRWWKRDQYRPREIMLQLIGADPELAAIAWKDLANESASLEGRLDRFAYYCSELLKIHRQKNPRSVESHHHQDASILSLYLAGMYPGTYALYPGLDIFQSFCRAIGRPDIPVVDDLVRYMKIARVVYTYLPRHEKYQQVLHQRGSGMHKVACIPFQLSYETILFEGERFKSQGV